MIGLTKEELTEAINKVEKAVTNLDPFNSKGSVPAGDDYSPGYMIGNDEASHAKLLSTIEQLKNLVKEG